MLQNNGSDEKIFARLSDGRVIEIRVMPDESPFAFQDESGLWRYDREKNTVITEYKALRKFDALYKFRQVAQKKGRGVFMRNTDRPVADWYEYEKAVVVPRWHWHYVDAISTHRIVHLPNAKTAKEAIEDLLHFAKVAAGEIWYVEVIVRVYEHVGSGIYSLKAVDSIWGIETDGSNTYLFQVASEISGIKELEVLDWQQSFESAVTA